MARYVRDYAGPPPVLQPDASATTLLIWRDVHGTSEHFIERWDIVGTLYGRVALDLPHEMPEL
jgi:hypothetical protein